jgi:MFS family permease
MLMGIATFLVAFVPSYESIGIWGAVILTVLRALQGVGVGGESGGSVLLAMEWSRTHGQRGLVAAIRRPLRAATINLGGACLQRVVGRSIRGLGLARSVRAFNYPRWRRLVGARPTSASPVR